MEYREERSGFGSLSLGARFGIFLGALLVLALVGLLLFRMLFVSFVDNYQMGYIYYGQTGKIVRMEHSGYVVTWPIVNAVHVIDLRPGQVCMNANKRVLNCKLVRFNPDAFDTFIEWHGRGAGEGMSSEHSGDSGGVYEILKSYAFNVNEGRDCPFLIILDDMRRKNTEGQLSSQAPEPPK